MAEENARLSNSLARAGEPQLSRDQMSELMRLRAQAGQLKRDLAAADTATQSQLTIQKLDRLAPPNDDPTKLYTPKFTQLVPTGRSLIMAGWSTAPGMHTFVFVTPSPITATGQPTAGPTPDTDARQILVQSRIFDVPETLMAQLRLDVLTSGGRETFAPTILSAAAVNNLLNALTTTDGVNILGQPRVTTSDGIGATIGITGANGPNAEGPGLSRSFEVTPHLAPDGSGIDLAVTAAFSLLAPRSGGN